MITEKEFNISNESYTKKDFYEIYPEILDLVKKITERWHPENSNESDPGVVLLKLLAFIADKNNYNIDKNILECFMPSATQEESMRKLCDMMGYDMKYYQSAKTDISFMWLGDLGEKESFKLDRFTTTIQSLDSDITYTLIEKDLVFNKDYKNKTQTCEAIEGQMFKLSIGDNENITLDNIDERFRLYLPETQIAENGIFVLFTNQNKQDKEWYKTTNLNSQLPGSLCWKFGYDSLKQLPYIQFPDDISQLIEDGLTIWYTRTSGATGNVSANMLTRLTSNKDVEINTDGDVVTLISDSSEGTVNLAISNKYATINGKDPETIGEAYNSFKKTVGTFDTLVTCRDYANRIYQMVTSQNDISPLVSNCQVADIRTNPFLASTVKSFNVYGEVSFDVSETEEVLGEYKNLISNFDLYLYPLKKIPNAYTNKSYDNSFKPDSANFYEITNNLRENKTISHQFCFPTVSELYLIKNYYQLSAKLTTTYKVSAVEAAEILTNVYTELYKNFNAHEVDYGKEIPFDTLLSVIKNADYRIKNVNLDEPELSTKFMITSGKEYAINDERDGTYLTNYEKIYIKLLSKNILAGRLPLFAYDTSFETDYTKAIYVDSESHEVDPVIGDDSNTTNQIHHLETHFKLPFSEINESGGYKLNPNEVIQFRAPSLRTTITYPYLVNYYFAPGTSTTVVNKNSEYQLATGDKLYIYYSESDENDVSYQHYVVYYRDGNTWKENDNGTITEFSGIIRVNFDLRNSINNNYWPKKQDSCPDTWKDTNGNKIGGMLALGAKEQIEIRDLVKITFDSNSRYNKFFWLTNDGYLFNEDSNVKTLKENEYLFYTNDAETELFALGSGTVLTSSLTAAAAKEKFYINYDNIEKVDADEVASDGLAAFSDVQWQVKKFSSDTLVCQEMQFITLTSGDIIEEIDYSGSQTTLDNTFVPITRASYTMLDKHDTLTLFEASNITWEVRSRFDISISPNASQKLYDYDSLKAFNSENTLLVELEGSNTNPPSISANYDFLKTGNTYISAVIPSITGEELNNFKLQVFSEKTFNNEAIQLNNYDDIYTKFDLESIDTSTKFNVLIPQGDYAAILMIHYNEVNSDVTVKLKSNKESLIFYKDLEAGSQDDELELSNGINTVWVDASSELYFEVTNQESGDLLGTIVLGNYSIVKSGTDNPQGIDIKTLNLADTNGSIQGSKVELLLDYLDDYGSVVKNGEKVNIFYYNYPIKTQEAIDLSNNIIDETFWFDVNNVAANMVMSEIDTTTLSNITIAKQSRRF